MTRIVVLGDLNVDVVAVQETSLAHGSDTAARVSLQPGGGGANVAAWLAKLGVEVTLIGRVGDGRAGAGRAQRARRRGPAGRA